MVYVVLSLNVFFFTNATNDFTLGWEFLSHPAYSPDLAQSDFYLLEPFKSASRGKRFANSG